MKTLTRFLLGMLLTALSLAGAHADLHIPHLGNGTYANPIIYADYSDPDVIRVGDEYYMVASSFTCMPGIPVLHSKDLVNWTIINHVYTSLPFDRYRFPAHANGSWAPSIRYHDGRYYVHFCTPEEGLFVATTDHPAHPWTLQQMVHVAKWEDPCPFWDDDGQAYLVHSIHRGGPAVLHRMSPDGMRLLDNGVTVYHDIEENPVLEGLKMMKKEGYYYILAPAGGVATGWQTVLRSENIYGPYESRRVLEPGNGINGPHQGGLVETQTGEWWFIHFQDKGVYGRIVHLQPAEWRDGWPVIGSDPEGTGTGIPVLVHRKPDVGAEYPVAIPQTSDEFDSEKLGLQWQWQAIERPEWYSLTDRPGHIRLFAVPCPTEHGNLYYAGNLLLQKISAPDLTATIKLTASFTDPGERAGITVFGTSYSYLALVKTDTGHRISLYEGRYDRLAVTPGEVLFVDTDAHTVWLRTDIVFPKNYDVPPDLSEPNFPDAICEYSYSFDGEEFIPIPHAVELEKGGWIGAKVGIFASSPNIVPGGGYADFEYFRVE